jgi:serine protease Do
LSPNPPYALAQNLSQEAQHLAQPTGFADVVAKVKPAVISVRVKVAAPPQASGDDDPPFPKDSPMERFFRRFGMPDGGPGGRRGRQFGTAQGSGFLISHDGYAVTNNHVVEKASTVEVTIDDGKTHTAKVIGTDPRTDLALIKIDGGNFPYVNLADKPPRVGDWVLASAIRSVSAAPLPPASSRRAAATLAPVPTMTSCRSTRRSTAAIRVGRRSTPKAA